MEDYYRRRTTSWPDESMEGKNILTYNTRVRTYICIIYNNIMFLPYNNIHNIPTQNSVIMY